MDIRECLSLRALLVVVFWGLAFVATRVALTMLTPAGLVATRLMIGCLTMLAVARLLGRSVLPRPADRARCVLLGLILTAHLLIQALGLVRTTATNTGWIIAFTPIAIAIGASLFLRDRMPGRTWIGIALGTAGVLLISLSSGTRFTDAKVGDLLQFVSCITWAAYTLLAVGPVARNGSLPVTFAAVAVAAVAAVSVGLLGPWAAGPATAEAVVAVAFLGLVCSAIAYWLWYAAVRDVGSTTAGAYLYLEPFVTWFAATMILDERLGGIALTGGVMVLAGVWVVSSARRPGG
ncbi:MAG: DMT family transporter [Planctomycetota bacterium]